MNNTKKMAYAVLENNTISLNTEHPYKWASGFYMPIYNDFRKFMFKPEYRTLITESMASLIEEEKIPYDIIAGVASSGIAPGILLAEKLKRPFIFVRNTAKDHGMKNNIEGIDKNKDLENRIVLLVEDVVSTGESSAHAIQSIRERNGVCNYCLALFSYDFPIAQEIFSGKRYFSKALRLEPGSTLKTVCSYTNLREVIQETGFFDANMLTDMDVWQKDPFGWGIKHGFSPGGT